MLQDSFLDVYTKFKLQFYQQVFEGWQGREVSLTTVETFCMEIIYAMNRPSVNEFARLANISPQNAAYKVNKLIEKGYLRKVQSTEDKREYYLEVTEKYLDYYNLSYTYLETVMKRMEKRFSKDELKVMEQVLNVMNIELMPEVSLKSQ